MSFGFSVGDFVQLTQIAHKTFRNCQEAGDEYVEIANAVRCLHSVLRTLRAEFQQSESKTFKPDPALTGQLLETAEGCEAVLDKLGYILDKYEGLTLDSQVGAGKKLWQRFRFGSKAEELVVIRSKLVTYTSTLSILIDTLHIQTAGRVETKIDGGFAELSGQFERMRKEIFTIAAQARSEGRKGSTMSTLSLSTYAGDEKIVWRDFRRELVREGFKSENLRKNKHVLLAYMIKLDQSGLLDRNDLTSDAGNSNPWWAKKMFTDTMSSLADLQLTEESTSSDRLPQMVIDKLNPMPAIGEGDEAEKTDAPGSPPSDVEIGPTSKIELVKNKSISQESSSSSTASIPFLGQDEDSDSTIKQLYIPTEPRNYLGNKSETTTGTQAKNGQSGNVEQNFASEDQGADIGPQPSLKSLSEMESSNVLELEAKSFLRGIKSSNSPLLEDDTSDIHIDADNLRANPPLPVSDNSSENSSTKLNLTRILYTEEALRGAWQATQKRPSIYEGNTMLPEPPLINFPKEPYAVRHSSPDKKHTKTRSKKYSKKYRKDRTPEEQIAHDQRKAWRKAAKAKLAAEAESYNFETGRSPTLETVIVEERYTPPANRSLTSYLNPRDSDSDSDSVVVVIEEDVPRDRSKRTKKAKVVENHEGTNEPLSQLWKTAKMVFN